MDLASFCYTSCLRRFIKRKTVLMMKMFMPAIKNPMDTINGKFSALKSLAVNAINNPPIAIAVQAIHLSKSAAFLSVFMVQNPCRFGILPCVVFFVEFIVTQNSLFVHVLFKFLLKICQNFFHKPIEIAIVTFFLCVLIVKRRFLLIGRRFLLVPIKKACSFAVRKQAAGFRIRLVLPDSVIAH